VIDMMSEYMDRRTNLVNELRKNMICASLDEAERMADEIMKREEQTTKDNRDMTKQVEEKFETQEKNKKTYLTKAEVESLLVINNKIIEANFVKLKNYTDQMIVDLQTKIKNAQSQINEFMEHPPMSVQVQHVQPRHMEEAPKTKVEKIIMPSTPTNKGGEFAPEDVSVDKIFYCGNK
jgi:hypothetical protein